MLYTPLHVLPVCQHERRPGTTVCVHCRHASRVAAREKRHRVMLRGGAFAIVASTFITAGVLGASAIRDRVGGRRSIPTAAAPLDTQSSLAAALPDTSRVVTPEAGAGGIQQPSVASRSAAPPFGPILPAGESPLSEGVTAVRTDSAIVVSFDSPMNRTRRPEKFESLVRATLPAIYGRGADSALAHLPAGALARQGDLFGTVSTHGLRIPAGQAWEIRLYPESRIGHDGPLVVRYRVSVVSSGE